MKTKFIEAVAACNLMKVRMMLADELLLDPRGGTFSEMLMYAKDRIPNLFQQHNDFCHDVSEDPSTWNIDLVSKIKQDLICNFSEEKLTQYSVIAMEVGKEKAQTLSDELKVLDHYSIQTEKNINKNIQTRKLRESETLDYLDSAPKTRHNLVKSTIKKTEVSPNESLLGRMSLKLYTDELSRRLHLSLDYVDLDSLDVKYDYEYVSVAEDYWKNRRKDILVDYTRFHSPFDMIERYKILRVTYCGVENKVIKLKYSAQEDILKSSYFKLLKGTIHNFV